MEDKSATTRLAWAACRDIQKDLQLSGVIASLYNGQGHCVLKPLATTSSLCSNDCTQCHGRALTGQKGLLIADGISELRGEAGQPLAVVPVNVGTTEPYYFVLCLPGDQPQPHALELTGQQRLHRIGAIAGKAGALLTDLLMDRTRAVHQRGHDLQALSESLVQSYEELALLHDLTGGSQPADDPRAWFQRLCGNITSVLQTEMVIALWHDGHEESPLSHVSSRVSPLARSLPQAIWTAIQKKRYRAGLLLSRRAGDLSSAWPNWLDSLVVVPIRRGSTLLGALAAINKQIRRDFDSTDVRMLTSVAGEMAVQLENHRLYEEMDDLLIGSLRALTRSIEAKDPYTCGHSERVALIARHIARSLGLRSDMLRTVYLTGLLHDVGKIGVHEAVLCKAGRLVEEEFAQIRRHPEIGARIVGGIRQMDTVSRAVHSHHERYDGRGYPNGLRGQEIPLAGRIVMLADCFDAMISNRTYRRALGPLAALAEIHRFSGTQFDPEIADAFLGLDLNPLLQSLTQVGSQTNVAEPSFDPILN